MQAIGIAGDKDVPRGTESDPEIQKVEIFSIKKDDTHSVGRYT